METSTQSDASFQGSGPSDYVSDTTASDASENLPAAGDDKILPVKRVSPGTSSGTGQEEPLVPDKGESPEEGISMEKAPPILRRSNRVNKGKPSKWFDTFIAHAVLNQAVVLLRGEETVPDSRQGPHPPKLS